MKVAKEGNNIPYRHTASFEDLLLLGSRAGTVYTVPLDAVTLVEVLITKFQ